LTSTTPPAPVPYPFNTRPGLGVHRAYADARASGGMIRVQMPYGEPAWLATRYADVRAVLGDHRCSRAPLARMELQEALRALVTAMPGLRVAGEVAWKEGMLVRSPRLITVGW
jgi:cytochrome P450